MRLQCRVDGELPLGRKAITAYGMYFASHCSIYVLPRWALHHGTEDAFFTGGVFLF